MSIRASQCDQVRLCQERLKRIVNRTQDQSSDQFVKMVDPTQQSPGNAGFEASKKLGLRLNDLLVPRFLMPFNHLRFSHHKGNLQQGKKRGKERSPTNSDKSGQHARPETCRSTCTRIQIPTSEPLLRPMQEIQASMRCTVLGPDWSNI